MPTITVSYEEGQLVVSPRNIQISPSGSITIQRVGQSGGTISVSGFSSTYFNGSSYLTFSSNNSQTKTAKGVAGTDAISFAKYNSTSVSATITLVDEDTEPDQFSFTDVTNVGLNSVNMSNEITLTGMNEGTYGYASLGNLWVNGIQRANPYMVYVGDKVKIEMTAANAYNTTRSSTFSVGGISDVFSVKTSVSQWGSPEFGTPIYFPVAASATTTAVKLSDIKDFFGGYLSPPTNLKGYYRNNVYVPDFSENNGIPASGEITLDMFRGSATALYWNTNPSNKHATGNQSATLLWTLGTSYSLGFGEGIDYSCDYKFVLVVTGANGSGATASDIVMTSGSNPLSYHADNRWLKLDVSVGTSGEREYEGYVTLYARSLFDTSVYVTTRVDFSILLSTEV
jgi:hypothetical protein